eukprot:SAG25_NODE_25_length_21717_cov_29.421778_16_plen_123_part_00
MVRMVPCCKPLLLYSQSQLLCSPSLEIQIVGDNCKSLHTVCCFGILTLRSSYNPDDSRRRWHFIFAARSFQFDCAATRGLERVLRYLPTRFVRTTGRKRRRQYRCAASMPTYVPQKMYPALV